MTIDIDALKQATAIQTDELRKITESVQEQVKKLRQDTAKVAAEAMSGASDFMRVHLPEVKAYSWVQYIPYFNDGDPCVFTACVEEGPIQFDVEHPNIELFRQVEFYADYKKEWVPYVDIDDDGEIDYFSHLIPTWRGSDGVRGVTPEAEDFDARWGVFIGMLQAVEESGMLEDMFGSYAKVTITPDGIEVEQDIEAPY